MFSKAQLCENVQIVCENLLQVLNSGQTYDDTLCCVIEDILCHDAALGLDKIWNLLRNVSHHSQNELLESMENLSSHAGFVRGWVRVMLNDGAIANVLNMLCDDDMTVEYYTPEAFILDRECVSEAVSHLKTLDSSELNYVCNTVTLNHWRHEQNEAVIIPYQQTAPDSPGFNRRYSIGNRLTGADDDEDDRTSVSSDTELGRDREDTQETLDVSLNDRPPSFSSSLYSENPQHEMWRASMSDVRTSMSDLSYMPEELASMLISDTEERFQYFSSIPREKGLAFQNFECYECKTSFLSGGSVSRYKVCTYDKRYYCHACFGSCEVVIPSKLLFNWDFNKYKVAKRNFDFINQVRQLPRVDISKTNNTLYTHVEELQEILMFRTQLNMIREYIAQCKSDSIYNEMRKKLGAHEYYWDTPHLYSISDLSKVINGQLSRYLKKLLMRCKTHVYCCRRCCSLGFVCELCKDPAIIFPFEMAKIQRCEKCFAVFHKACKQNAACPKCVRRERYASIKSESVDEGLT